MKKKIFLSLVLLLTALSLSAVPARPGRYRFTQPDGSTVLLNRHGDEWGHWLTDAQGRTVVKGADGYYRPVSESQAQSMRRQATARRAEARRRHQFHATGPVAKGKKHFLVVLVEFPDRAFSTADAKTAFNNLMNQKGYDANGATGSARDYYYENSQGSFEPVFDVYGPVTVSHDMAYYGGNDENGNDKKPEEAVYEACLLLDGQIDFSRYDNDGDGEVDLVFMYYAGYGEADYSDEDTIWPHQWNLSYGGLDLELDGKKVDAYACTNELLGYGDRSGTMVGIGTACHEFGHAMGLPDFYDTDYDTNGIAGGLLDFSLMDSGAYNNDGRTPPYFNIEERILLGWLDESALQEFPKSGDYTLGPVWEGKAYKTPTDQDGEYFVYEVRDVFGWDAHLPTHGLLVYHVDKSANKVQTQDYGQVTAADLWSKWTETNCINESGSHPCFYVVPAVDQGNLKYGFRYLSEYGASYFDPDGEGLIANIPFPGAGNVTTYTAKSWSGVDSEISLSGITYANLKASFTVTMPAPASLLNYYTIKNPGKGVYAAGASFALELNEVADRPYSSVEWRLDGTKVTGSSVALTAGAHTVEAVVTLSNGKRQTVVLEINVQ